MIRPSPLDRSIGIHTIHRGKYAVYFGITYNDVATRVEDFETTYRSPRSRKYTSYVKYHGNDGFRVLHQWVWTTACCRREDQNAPVKESTTDITLSLRDTRGNKWNRYLLLSMAFSDFSALLFRTQKKSL